jgi:hypothetical protein
MIATALHIRAVSAATREGEIRCLKSPAGKEGYRAHGFDHGHIQGDEKSSVVITHCKQPLGGSSWATRRIAKGTNGHHHHADAMLTTYYAGDQALIICF